MEQFSAPTAVWNTHRAIQLSAAGAILVAVAGSGCSGHSGSDKGASATAAVNGTVSRQLAPAPTTCPGPKPRPKKVTPGVNRVIGRSPVWAGPYGMLDPKTGALQMVGNVPRTRYGWRDKVLWLVAYHHKGVIRLRGRNLTTGTALEFNVELSGVGTTTTGLLNHGKPGAVTNPGEPKQFPSYIYFTEAGCYVLSASWNGGSWKIVLGLGR